jgi:hypothetical protein
VQGGPPGGGGLAFPCALLIYNCMDQSQVYLATLERNTYLCIFLEGGKLVSFAQIY